MILSKNKINKLDADSLINDFIKDEKLNELLLIVPTNRKIRYLKREIVSKSPNKSASKLNLHTFATFAEQIFQKNNFDSVRLLSEASSAVLLNKAFKETELKYFSNYRDEIPRGTLERIKNVITEYKLNGISSDQLLKESKKLEGSEKLKAIDIANVYHNFQLACNGLKVYEVGDIYSEVLSYDLKSFESKFRISFAAINTIIINGFDEFTQPEIEIINQTAEIGGINLFILFDYYNYNPTLFSHLDKCYYKFKEKGFCEVEDNSLVQLNKYQKRIREKLFLLNENDFPAAGEVDVIKVIAQSPDEEIILIAKEIKKLITENNVDVESIAVVFNMISDHSIIVRDVFKQYGIPFNLTDRFSLSESQPIISLINFLEILQNNFYYKNIFRAVTGRWIKLSGLDLSNLLRVSSNLKIVSGYKNWTESIERTIEEINDFNIDEDSRFLPLSFYIKAKDDIENIFKVLTPFKENKNILDFRDDLIKLVFTLDLPKLIINDHPEYIEKNVKAVTVFLETINELFNLLALEYGVEKKFSLSFFLSQIKTALLFTRYNIKERHANGVLVTSVNEIRGLNYDYVFIGGLVDGKFPTRYQPEVFFSGSYKKDEYRHLLEDRYHFYQTLCSARKSLYLTSACKDEKKEFTPSTFLSDFSRLFKVKEIKSEDYLHLIYNRSELLKYAGSLDVKIDKIKFEEFGLNHEKIKYELEIDKLRLENPFTESAYTGYISNELNKQANEKLKEQKLKQYSASQLEEYAKCPFQYFAKRILLLDTMVEPTEELEAFELGSLVHSILFEFYKTIEEKKIILSGCKDEDFIYAEKLIFDIAEKKIEKLHLSSSMIFFEKEKILGVAGNKKNSILYKFLEQERTNDDGFVPQYFELEFGQFNKQNTEMNEMLVGDVKVRGKIDRIDIDQAKDKIKIVDYKLGGKKPSKKDLESGLSLQLPLYLYASKKLIDAELRIDSRPALAIIYSLKLNKDEFGEKKIHISSSRKPSEDDFIKSNEELIKICIEFIPAYVDKITNGIFSLSQLEDRESKVCRFCDFKSICRIQDAL
ncbi:MAG: PD-(D/E)XK nuclease family protein [Ignavibacteriaceae bacterium]